MEDRNENETSGAAYVEVSGFPPDRDRGTWAIDPHFIIGGRYEVRQELSSGTFGVVYQVFDLEMKQLMALKLMNAAETSICKSATDAEVENVKRIQRIRKSYPNDRTNIVDISDILDLMLRENCYGGNYGQSEIHKGFVMELLGQEISTIIDKNSHPIPVAYSIVITKQLLVALQFLHEKCGITHLDVKSENVIFVSGQLKKFRLAEGSIVLPSTAAVRLIDFNSAAVGTNHEHFEAVTLGYRPPEITLGGRISSAADIFSLGAVFVEMLTGICPFVTFQNEEEDMFINLMRIQRMPYCQEMLQPAKARMIRSGNSSRRRIVSQHSLDTEYALRVLFSKNALRRCDGVQMAIQWKKITKGRVGAVLEDLVLKMIHGSPTRRITASEALAHQLFQIPLHGVPTTP